MKTLKRPRFLLDLGEELTWLNEHAGPEVAERWYDALLATIDFIGKNPRVGRERKDLMPPGIRSWRIQDFPRWLVFYRITDQGTVIFYHVRSGTMNLLVLRMES